MVLNTFENPTVKVKCWCIPGADTIIPFISQGISITNPYHHWKCSKLFQNQRHHAQPKWHRFDSTELPIISRGWSQWNQFFLCCCFTQSISPFPSVITLSTRSDHILHLPLIHHNHHHHLLKVERFFLSLILSQVFSGCRLLCRSRRYETLCFIQCEEISEAVLPWSFGKWQCQQFVVWAKSICPWNILTYISCSSDGIRVQGNELMGLPSKAGLPSEEKVLLRDISVQ